jgi:hypothetical protein
MSKNQYFAPGIRAGDFISPKDESRNNSKWNLMAVSQGPSYGLITDHAHSDDRNAPLDDRKEPTCELPVSTGGERYYKGNELWLTPEGQFVPACTRGCQQSWRKGVCFHGVPFTEHCTDNCFECRKPHRSRPAKFRGDAWTSQNYDQTKCLPPWKLIPAGLQALWEHSLKTEPWSEEELRGRDQSKVSELAVDLRRIQKRPVYVDFDGTVIQDNPWISNRDTYRKAAIQLETQFGIPVDDGAVSLLKSHAVPRLTPIWVINKTFLTQFIEWLYPRVETQSLKREFAKALITKYWVEFLPADVVQEEMQLTEDGLKKRLQRLKDKAAEFANRSKENAK